MTKRREEMLRELADRRNRRGVCLLTDVAALCDANEEAWHDIWKVTPTSWGCLCEVKVRLLRTSPYLASVQLVEAGLCVAPETWKAQLDDSLTKQGYIAGEHGLAYSWKSHYRGRIHRGAGKMLEVTEMFRYDACSKAYSIVYRPSVYGSVHLMRGDHSAGEQVMVHGKKMRFYALELLDGEVRGMLAKFAVFENSRLWDRVPGKGEYAYGRFNMRGKYLNLVDIYPLDEGGKIWI